MQHSKEVIHRVCPVDNVAFDTHHPGRLYCSVRCRALRKRQKERIRDAGNALDVDVEASMYFVAPIYQPDTETIVATALLMTTAKPTKPCVFRQVRVNRPAVLPPDIQFEPTVVRGEWLMEYTGQPRIVESTPYRSPQQILDSL